MAFQKAVRTKSKARVVIVGPSKSGKSMTALRIARGLVGPEGRIAARDSEAGSLSKYAALEGEPETDIAFRFDTDEPRTHSPEDYVRAIRDAEKAGYDVILLDSLSHAWIGTGGALEIVDNATGKGDSKFSSGWAKATPIHNQMLDAINGSSIHVIATLRTKMEYVLEMNSKGKMAPRKVGMAPVQRDGIEYEFDLTCTMDREHRLTVDGTRCPDLEEVYECPTQEVGEALAAWLGQGIDAKPRQEPEAAASEPTTADSVQAEPLSKGQAADLNTACSVHADRLCEFDELTEDNRPQRDEMARNLKAMAAARPEVSVGKMVAADFAPFMDLLARAYLGDSQTDGEPPAILFREAA